MTSTSPVSDRTVTVTRTIHADAKQLWAMVADVTRMPEWSPETVAATWLDGASTPAAGAKFRGTNRNGNKSWKTVATITEAVPGRVLAFRVKAGGLNIAEWHYRFEPAGAGCSVTETWTDRRGPLLKAISPRVTGVDDRATHNRSGIEKTLERLANAAEPTIPADV
jgi:uncharacterized protein YndB with AHSA1/START domain